MNRMTSTADIQPDAVGLEFLTQLLRQPRPDIVETARLHDLVVPALKAFLHAVQQAHSPAGQQFAQSQVEGRHLVRQGDFMYRSRAILGMSLAGKRKPW